MRTARSYRDPAGFIFHRAGILLRQVNQAHAANFELLQSSGLYDALTAGQLLVSHECVDLSWAAEPGACAILKPQLIPFISYPYEWCFSQLQAAALTTLNAQKIALAHGMTLKDASAYNVQFTGIRPSLIDTLSFERYSAGEPWIAYRQFCEHFLAPLALMSYGDPRVNRMTSNVGDGIPLDAAIALLPLRAYASPAIAMHLVMHAHLARRATEPGNVSRSGKPVNVAAIIASLASAVAGMRRQHKSRWSKYHSSDSYSASAYQHKVEIVRQHLRTLSPRLVYDIGANTGDISAVAAEYAETVVAIDDDADTVDAHWQNLLRRGVANVLPLIVDIANPSPGAGWGNTERSPFLQRARPDVVLMLALLHHVVIGRNVPLPLVAELLAALTDKLIIEFVPPEDKHVAGLLAAHNGIAHPYNQLEFERAFGQYFVTLERTEIIGSGRSIYRMGKTRS